MTTGVREDGGPPPFHNHKKNYALQVTLTPLRGVHRIFWGLYVRTDMVHREALILFTSALRTLPEILLGLVKRHLPAAVDADILAGTDFLSGFCFLGQFDHQIQIWKGKLFMTFDSSNQTLQNVKIRPK